MLSKKQLSLLKTINKRPMYIPTDDVASEISYMLALGYISRHSEGGDRWGNGENVYYSITEFGKAYLYDVHKTNMRFVIPVTISICSLIISVIALVITWISSLQ